MMSLIFLYSQWCVFLGFFFSFVVVLFLQVGCVAAIAGVEAAITYPFRFGLVNVAIGTPNSGNPVKFVHLPRLRIDRQSAPFANVEYLRTFVFSGSSIIL
jgi:hypothetical protein